MPTFKLTSYNTADTAIAGTTLNNLGDTAYAYGSEIDNSSGLFLYGDLIVELSSAIASYPPAFLTCFILPVMNVTGNYAASSGFPGQNYLERVAGYSGSSIQFMQIRGLVMPPYKFKIVLQNNLKIAFPATNTNVCNLYRYSEQSV